MRNLPTGALALLLTLGVAACQPASQADLDKIADVQKEILEKLSAHDDKLVSATTRPAAAQQAQKPTGPDASKVYNFDVSGSPMMGNPEAAITLVKFSDFGCGHCVRAAKVLQDIVDKHGDSVRVVYKHFPIFGERSEKAARSAFAAQAQGKFWEYEELMFQKIKGVNGSFDEAWAGIAADAGLDVDRFKQDFVAKGQDNGEYHKRVISDQAQGQTAGVNATPMIFINGKYHNNYNTLADQIDAMVKAAGA